MTRSRINWIDFGKGLAIFLVLMVHVLLGLYQSEKFPSWNNVLVLLIAQLYIFHIPVFFALSGYFFKPLSNIKEFLDYSKKKTIVLGIPYIFYSIIHFCLQKIAGGNCSGSHYYIWFNKYLQTPSWSFLVYICALVYLDDIWLIVHCYQKTQNVTFNKCVRLLLYFICSDWYLYYSKNVSLGCFLPAWKCLEWNSVG